MTDEPRILTAEEIEAGRSPRGGWTRATLAGWGVPWPPPHGWKRALKRGEKPAYRNHEDRRRDAVAAAEFALREYATRGPQADWAMRWLLAAHAAGRGIK